MRYQTYPEGDTKLFHAVIHICRPAVLVVQNVTNIGMILYKYCTEITC